MGEIRGRCQKHLQIDGFRLALTSSQILGYSGGFSVAELTVRSAQSDLLEVDPLDLGSDAPAAAALEVERGPQPRDMPQRGD